MSVDMEGISGIHDWDDTLPEGSSYQFARTLLTKDVNAAIEGAIQAGASEIVVNESNGPSWSISFIRKLLLKWHIVTNYRLNLLLLEVL
ncbi:M55 family metallopeptidase [Brevibacillus borstelensis]